MKVLYLIDSLSGYGAEKSLCEIVIRFSKVTPVVVQIYQGNDLVPFLEKNGVKVYSLDLAGKLDYDKALKGIENIIFTENPQIIHATLFRSESLGRKLKVKYPELVLVGSFVSNSYSFRRYGQLSMLSKIKLLSTQFKDLKTVKKVDFFIANSDTVKKTNSRALRVSATKIYTIPRGREIPLQGNRTHIPQGVPSKDDKKIFLNVGRLQKSKGQKEMIVAFKKLLNYTDAYLLIAGEGEYKEKLQEVIENLHLKEKVFLLGYRKDIPDLLTYTDFFVFPSHFEGLPGALLEAIFSKTPAIISNIPENSECVPEGSVLLFSPGDVDQIADRMFEALNVDQWDEKVELAYNFAIDNFEINKVSRLYEDFYLHIAQK